MSAIRPRPESLYSYDAIWSKLAEAVPITLGSPLKDWVLTDDLAPYRASGPKDVVKVAIGNRVAGSTPSTPGTSPGRKPRTSTPRSSPWWRSN